MFGLVMTLYVFYFFQVADNFKEYIECATTTSSVIIFGVCYASVAFRMTELFEGIGEMEKLIETREQKCTTPIRSLS